MVFFGISGQKGVWETCLFLYILSILKEGSMHFIGLNVNYCMHSAQAVIWAECELLHSAQTIIWAECELLHSAQTMKSTLS